MAQSGTKPTQVKVVWGTSLLPRIMYGGQSFSKAVEARLALRATSNGVELHPRLNDLIEELMASVEALPSTQGRKKVLLADAIFGHFFIQQYPSNPKLKSQFCRAILD